MDITSIEKPLVLTREAGLFNQVRRCYKEPVKIFSAEELSTLFEIVPGSTGATLLLDLSQFNHDVDHPAVKTIFKQCFELRIIAITSEQNPANLYKLFEQGARGFCRPTISDKLLIKAIRAVDDGELWMERKLIGYLMSRLILDRAGKSGTAPNQTLGNSDLTPRESEIASCVAKGKCDKIIARDLDISPNTVKNHMRNIFCKLQISDRFQLALIYHGIELH